MDFLCKAKWMKKMGKEPNGDNQGSKANQDKTQDEMLFEIMNLFTEPDMDWLEAVQKLAAKRRAKKYQKDAAADKDKGEDKGADED
jgi:hypothetical protein